MPRLSLGLGAQNIRKVGGFSPSNLSGLSLWLKSDTGVTTSGSNVTAWADQSGTGKNMTASGGDQPTFIASELNGKPVIDFATSKYLTASFSAINFTQQTVFVVFKFVSANLSNFARPFSQSNIDYEDSQTPGNLLPLLRNDGTDYMWCFSANDSFLVGSPTSNNAWYISTTKTNGTNGSFSLNATNEQAFTTTFNPSITNMQVGGALTTGGGMGDPFNSKLAEVIVYDRNLTAPESQQVQTYLANKYAIQIPNINNLFLPQLWLKADAGVTLSGSDVTAWADQSGNGNNASAEEGYEPTFVSNILNSKPVLRFDGTGPKLGLTSSIGGTAYTILIVCKNNDNVNGSMFFWTTEEDFGRYIGVSTDENYNEDARNKFLLSEADAGGGGEGSVLAWSSASATNNFFIGTATQNGGGKAYLNGAGGTNSLGTFSASNTFDLIGGYGFGYELDGDVAEIIAYNRAVTTTERQQVEAYLNTKYAIY